MLPSISIVVTCYNYGHFLEACLVSLSAQTRAADQIIVVDDGSTDHSRDVARRHSGQLILIEKQNGGQASAFNAGFARATGDIVLFLDADDTLAPDALELICQAWHESLSSVSFRLNLIDGAGRLSGSYAAEPDGGDMRPELMGCGHFEFMPTSGNAFNRRLIAPAFPLPEARWRVSADAVLVRAAALAGPMKQLPFVLGNYRAHGGNAYHRTVMPRLQSMQRAIRDMADACLAVADRRWGTTTFGDDPEIVRLELVLASLRRRLSLPQFGDKKPRRLRAVWSALGILLQADIGLRAKAVYALCLTSLPLAAGLAPRLDLWVAAPDERPRALSRAIAWALGSKLIARRRIANRSRWLERATVGQFIPRGARESGATYFNIHDWRVRARDRSRVLCSRTGEIILPIDYFPDGALLDLDVRSVPPFAQMPVEVSITAGGQLLGEITVFGEGRLTVVLEPKTTLLEQTLRLTVAAVPRPTSIRQRWISLTGPSAIIEVAAFKIEPLPETKTGILLGLGEHRAFDEIARACQISPPPDPEAGWPHSIDAQEVVLAFVKPNLSEAAALAIRFSNEQIEGSLVVTDHAAAVYRGWIGPSGVVHIPIAPRRFVHDRDLTLSLSLDPDDPFAAPEFRIASIGLVGSGSSVNESAHHQFPVIGPGQIWRLEEDTTNAAACLGEGWTRCEEGAELFETLGILRLAVSPETFTDPTLHLLLGPSASLPDDATLTVAVSIDAVPISQILLQGEHDLTVPLGDALARHGRRLELALHAALSSTSADGDAAFELGRGGLLLRAIRLTSSPREMSALPSPPRRFLGHTLTSAIQAASRSAREACTREDAIGPAEISELAAQRSHLASAIRTLASGSVLSILLNPETLDALCDLGETLRQTGRIEEVQGSGEELSGLFGADPIEAVRALALAMLSVPPSQALAGHGPEELSEVLRTFPSQLARYLCSASQQDDPVSYGNFVHTLLRYARDRLTAEPTGSRHERLAEELLRQVRLDPLVTAPVALRDASGALGAAIEAHLVRRGRRITLAGAQARRSGRLRLGVFLRDARDGPESDLLSATIAALPPHQFDIVVFALEAGSTALAIQSQLEPTFILNGTGGDRAVEIIRAAELDIFLDVASFRSYDEVAVIIAHRLAPIAVAAVSPPALTTGLRSFDVVVTPLPELPDLVAGRCERVVRFAPEQLADSAPDVAAFAVYLAAVVMELGSAGDAS
jgi:glycosyltransferase involved in cell wall biosynthesis